jgi:ribosomal-protein-alanine N-acetyltransferase
MLKIRLFEPTDMFSVIKLASDTLPERYNPSLFNYFFETFPQGFIVAEIAHKIIGFIIGVKINLENVKILMLSISEDYRKQKIGSMLLTRLINGIKIEHVQHIDLEVRIDNVRAIKFYLKHGFKISQKIIEFYQDSEDAYTMSKNL